MAVDTRDIETDAPTDASPGENPFERAVGVVLMVAGTAGVAWAVPSALRYPMALAVAVAITAVGAGVAWRKPWSWSGLLCLGLLLCSASIGYLLIDGARLFTFSWFFLPGAYFMWVGIRGIRDGRRIAAHSV